jgi:hypothetical protein
MTGRSCLAISPEGVACTKTAYHLAPVALCFNHAFTVYLSIHGEISSNLKRVHDEMAIAEMGPTLQGVATKAAYEEQSQVYYVRIGDYIKIGFTRNMTERLKSLRVDASDVMATEPGGRDKERERHEQFADIRRGRKENFERTPELLTHIAKVRRENGKPKITGHVVLDKDIVSSHRGSLFKRSA